MQAMRDVCASYSKVDYITGLGLWLWSLQICVYLSLLLKPSTLFLVIIVIDSLLLLSS